MNRKIILKKPHQLIFQRIENNTKVQLSVFTANIKIK